MKLGYPVLALTCLASTLSAQVAGSISGFVRDPTGAAVPNATVTAVSEEQQLTRSTASDTTGFFNLLSMQSGVYEITVSAAGLEKQVQRGVRLTLGENLRVDFTLKLGSLQSEVVVSSAATLVNTTSQTLSGLVDDRR